MAWKVADQQGDISSLVTGLHRETLSLYDSIRRGVDRVLVVVSGCLKKAFCREALSLQQSVCEAVGGAAEWNRELVTNAPVAINKKLGVVVGQAAGTGESA